MTSTWWMGAETPDRFDRYSVDPNDEMLALGGRPAAVRHDPTGHEDCAREWDPCQCHGDRLCRLGMLRRWYRNHLEHQAWLRGERETPLGLDLLRMAGFQHDWERVNRLRSGESLTADLARDIWPLIVANGRQAVEGAIEHAALDAVTGVPL